jgi:MFS family permease
VAMVFMGVCSISFIATANATIQLQADPAMRGRVMALYAIAFLGSTPIGAPLVGWIADVTSPRVSIAVGGVATLAACIPLALRYSRRGAVRATDAVLLEQPDAEPGEVVDFAPGPLIDSPSEQAQLPLRRAGTA